MIELTKEQLEVYVDDLPSFLGWETLSITMFEDYERVAILARALIEARDEIDNLKDCGSPEGPMGSALTDIWQLLAYKGEWEYPGQVVLHIRALVGEKDDRIAALERDCRAYRFALGYEVSAEPRPYKLLSDGIEPVNGIAVALEQHCAALTAELEEAKQAGLAMSGLAGRTMAELTGAKSEIEHLTAELAQANGAIRQARLMLSDEECDEEFMAPFRNWCALPAVVAALAAAKEPDNG